MSGDRKPLSSYWAPQYWPVWLGMGFLRLICWLPHRAALATGRAIGHDDRFFRPEVVTRMWERWEQPAIQWYPGSHMGFIASLPDAVRRLRTFVDDRVA